MTVDRCHDCNASLGTFTQEVLPGVQREKRCGACETQYAAKWMLKAIVAEPLSMLSDWERDFLDSVNRQVATGKTLSEKQYQVVERIYGKATA